MMFTNRPYLLWLTPLGFVFWLGLSACATQESPPPDPYAVYAVPSPQELSLNEFLARAGGQDEHYLQQLSYTSTEAKYFDLVNQTLTLNQAELALLKQNGFVVSDRLTFADFTTAYAYIYWKDLPVLVTTDSMLQAVHQLYDDLLIRLEETSFTARLTTLLTHVRQQLLAEAKTNNDPDLALLYTDLEIYLTVPLALLTGEQYDTPGVAAYLELAQSADRVAEIDLFGSRRVVDFTLFKPRGHYTKSEALERYFRAVSWLALIDFRLVEYSPGGNSILNLEQLAAAAMLRQAIDAAGQRPTWAEFEALFRAFVGRSDNVTLPDLDRFLAEAGVNAPVDLIHHPDSRHLLTLLTSRDYGQQRITAQILNAAPDMPSPAPRPVSFMLLGQRFTVDSYLMNNLVYDRLLVDGQKVERPLPSPLDVMYILGNDRAATHLQDELARYGYQGHLAALREAVDHYEPTFWTDTTTVGWARCES